MRITQVKVRLFEYPMPKPFHPTWQPLPTTAARVHVVEVHTDEGIVGIGSGGVPVRWEVAGTFGPQRVFVFGGVPAATWGTTGSIGTQLTFKLGRWTPYVAYDYFSTATAAGPALQNGSYLSHSVVVGLNRRF